MERAEKISKIVSKRNEDSQEHKKQNGQRFLDGENSREIGGEGGGRNFSHKIGSVTAGHPAENIADAFAEYRQRAGRRIFIKTMQDFSRINFLDVLRLSRREIEINGFGNCFSGHFEGIYKIQRPNDNQRKKKYQKTFGAIFRQLFQFELPNACFF